MHPNKTELEKIKKEIKDQVYLCKCLTLSDSYMRKIEDIANSLALFYGERDMVIVPGKDWVELKPDEQEKIITDFYKEHGRSGLAPNDHIITQPREAEEALQNIFLKKWSEKKTETVYSIVRQRENEKLEELNRRKKELESVYEKEKLLYAEQGTLFDMNSL